MKPVLAIVFSLLIIIPLVVIGWLSVRVSVDESQRVERKFEELLNLRLADTERVIATFVGEVEQELEALIDGATLTTDRLRELVGEQRFARQIFVLSADYRMEHPPMNLPRNAEEEHFLKRTGHIWTSNERFYSPVDSEGDEAQDSGWYNWYFGGGVNLIYWKRLVTGQVVGVEVERMALIAALIGALPDDKQDQSSPSHRIDLKDASGKTIYSWGTHQLGEGISPVATIALSPPLGAWRLEYYVSPTEMTALSRSSSVAGNVAGFGALILIVIGLAVYFFKESNRAVRDAENKVTFVNQVSHELKTPLTNIRMYAELLEDQVAEDDERSQKYLDVIVKESQRLSRLIGNVLAFARQQKNKIVLRRSEGRIDEALRDIAEQFRPALERNGLYLELALETDGPSMFDGDALGQIIGNLLSNVEKYAADGREAVLSSRREGDQVAIVLEDRGPGIPRREWVRVFNPFVRLGGSLTEDASGTGIGLAIAKKLAVLHGGDLVILPSSRGATFQATLRAPLFTGDDK